MRIKRCTEAAAAHINLLPQDLIVEVVVKIATASPAPLRDIVNLRSSCKMMYEASKSREVGRRLAVTKEWMLHWWNKERFLDLLRSCAESGNLEASYILGLEEFYNRRRKSSGVRHLYRAMAGGHCVAAYMMSIILLHNPQTQSLGMKILERIATANDASDASATMESESFNMHKIRALRKKAASMMRKVTMERWPLEPRVPCADHFCGKVVKMGGPDAWWGEEEMRFCSQQCRWKHEYYKFFEKI